MSTDMGWFLFSGWCAICLWLVNAETNKSEGPSVKLAFGRVLFYLWCGGSAIAIVFFGADPAAFVLALLALAIFIGFPVLGGMRMGQLEEERRMRDEAWKEKMRMRIEAEKQAEKDPTAP